MMKRALFWVTAVAVPLFGCSEPVDESSGVTTDTPELLGREQAEICYFSNAPPAGFTADVVRSLDGYGSLVESDGYSGPGNCDFYTMDLDTSPDRADDVFVWFETQGACDDADAGEQGAFVWKRLGSGATATWSYQNIPLDSYYDDDEDVCHWGGEAADLNPAYTRLILAGKGRNPNGTAVAPTLAARESSHGNDFIFPPVLCPVGTTPPAADATRSLDGATTVAAYSAVPAVAGCDFVTMSVDTDPDRARLLTIDVLTDTCDELDGDSVELYVWKRLGSGPFYSWSHERVYPFTSSGLVTPIDPDLCGASYNAILPSGNEYTRLVLAGRAVTDAGQPVASIQLRVAE